MSLIGSGTSLDTPKTCATCKETLTRRDFYLSPLTGDHRQYSCKTCVKEKSSQRIVRLRAERRANGLTSRGDTPYEKASEERKELGMSSRATADEVESEKAIRRHQAKREAEQKIAEQLRQSEQEQEFKDDDSVFAGIGADFARKGKDKVRGWSTC